MSQWADKDYQKKLSEAVIYSMFLERLNLNNQKATSRRVHWYLAIKFLLSFSHINALFVWTQISYTDTNEELLIFMKSSNIHKSKIDK